MSILIADAGSTKIEWALIEENGNVSARWTSPGLNALLAELEDVEASMRDVVSHLGDNKPAAVYYYGAGCATPRVCNKMHEAVADVLGASEIHIESDLLGAARSLFGKSPGIACILGTGSNSCLYDGNNISHNIPSLGYVLGDEGSGAALGKRLVADAFKGQIPAQIGKKLLEQHDLTLSNLLDKIYRTPGANKFLASLVPFIKENIWNPYVYSLVYEEFSRFISRNVALYRGAHTLPIAFTGSIAAIFEDILRNAAEEQGFKVVKITAAPMDGLIESFVNEKR